MAIASSATGHLPLLKNIRFCGLCNTPWHSCRLLFDQRLTTSSSQPPQHLLQVMCFRPQTGHYSGWASAKHVYSHTPCRAGHGPCSGAEEAVCLICDVTTLLAHIQPCTLILRFFSLGPAWYSASFFKPVLVQWSFCHTCRPSPFLLKKKWRVHCIYVGPTLKFFKITLNWSTPVNISHYPWFADLLRVHSGVSMEVVTNILNNIKPTPAPEVLCVLPGCSWASNHHWLLLMSPVV